MSTQRSNMNNRMWGECVRGARRGRDVVKDCEMRYLCNRPHAKIIQAWSEINVRAWKLGRNPMPSCGPERQNKMYKRVSNAWGMLSACLYVCEECYWSESHWPQMCTETDWGKDRQLNNIWLSNCQCAYLYLWRRYNKYYRIQTSEPNPLDISKGVERISI